MKKKAINKNSLFIRDSYFLLFPSHHHHILYAPNAYFIAFLQGSSSFDFWVKKTIKPTKKKLHLTYKNIQTNTVLSLSLLLLISIRLWNAFVGGEWIFKYAMYATEFCKFYFNSLSCLVSCICCNLLLLLLVF